MSPGIGERRTTVGVILAASAAVASYYAAHRATLPREWFGAMTSISLYWYYLAVRIGIGAFAWRVSHDQNALSQPRPMSIRQAAGWLALHFGVKHGLDFGAMAVWPAARPECVVTVTRDPMYFAQAALVGPMVETLVFQVLLITALLRVARPEVAVILAAFVFSSLHDNYDWFLRLSSIFPSALIMGAAWYWTRSVWLVAVSHALQNVVSISWLIAAHDVLGLPYCSTSS